LDGEVTIDGSVTSGVVDGAIVGVDGAVTVDGAGGSRDSSALRGTKLGMISKQCDDN
jgi:hypothetical protein